MDSGKEYSVWRCGKCHCFIKLAKGAVSNATAHWNKHKHGEPLGVPSLPTVLPSTDSGQKLIYTTVNIERWRAKLLRWLIVDYILFAQVKSEMFRNILVGLHAPIEHYIVTTTTI